MNKLFVPKRSFFMGFADLFNPLKRAASAKWFLTPIFWTLIITALGLLFGGFLNGEIDNFSIINSVVISAVYYFVEFTIIKIYRKNIMADMKSAKLFYKMSGFRRSVNGNGEYTVYVPTMAGELRFVGDKLFSSNFSIGKKLGKLFDYYEFPETEGLNKKNLRIFIVVKNDLD